MVYELQMPSPTAFSSHVPSTRASTLKLRKGLEQKVWRKINVELIPVVFPIQRPWSNSLFYMTLILMNLRPRSKLNQARRTSVLPLSCICRVSRQGNFLASYPDDRSHLAAHMLHNLLNKKTSKDIASFPALQH
ncbi:hypothetical protein RDI58_014390 [Solanum bulbocastanum]|uniref:Uncharacterized protein n=1 Tax=Solanum bulbocastanum TaxID=147425 RepID=A0AAN8TEV1_SOLBU